MDNTTQAEDRQCTRAEVANREAQFDKALRNIHNTDMQVTAECFDTTRI